MTISIYFDNNATTKIAPEVFEAMTPFMTDAFGNASSTYSLGEEGRHSIREARKHVAHLVGANHPKEIFFTSCGTESDNWAILGTLADNFVNKHVIISAVEHDAVRKLCGRLADRGVDLTILGVDEHGAIDLDELKNALKNETALVSIMWANNETGVLFPVQKAAAIVKENSNAVFHTDAVNAVGKMTIDLRNSAIDLLSLSAHKFNGPKGVGALYIRDGLVLEPFLIGGGQEGGRRAGTEAVHQIAGLGRAAQLSADLSQLERVRSFRDLLENGILESIPNTYVNGSFEPEFRLPNTSNISFENTNGEMILARLENAGIAVSTGSACNSADHNVSGVLQAMNVPYARAMGSIRFSLGRYNTMDEVERTLEVLPPLIAELRRFADAGG